MDPTGHPILGLLVIGLILLLPPLGWMHHVVFVKKRGPSPYTYLHRWIGRVALVLGGINGGTGIWMAHDMPFWGIIAYSACAAFFFGTWFATAGLLELIRRRGLKKEREEAEEAGRGRVLDSETGSSSGEETEGEGKAEKGFTLESRV